MKKNQTTKICIIVCVLVIVAGTILCISLKEKAPEDNKIHYDQVYWNMQELYGGDDRIVDVVNNDKYYTINVYNKNTNEIMNSFKMDPYTGKITEISKGITIGNETTK